MNAAIYFLDASALSEPEREAWLAGAEAHLDADELARMRRYMFPDKRLELLLGRVLLRSVLQAFHGAAAGARILAPESGKPRIEGGPFFNLSHSHGAIAAIVAPGVEVSIDVERVRPYSDELVRGCLREEERPGVRSEEDFYRVWTAKESFMKLRGEGLSIPPRSLRADLDRRVVLHVPSGEERAFRTERRGEFILSWMMGTVPAP